MLHLRHLIPLLVLIIASSTDLLLTQGAPLTVELTLVHGADAIGAVCLDGSLPGYHIDFGSGTGSNKWVIHLQGGAWCASPNLCAQRTLTSLGSSNLMNASVFQGILSNNPRENPHFYNWNRVKVRYCDGGSFSGNVDQPMQGRFPGSTKVRTLYYRGQRIWQAVLDELLSRGLYHASQAILSGESAGGLAALIHCNDFRDALPDQVDVKCISDGGMFLDISDITGNPIVQSLFSKVVDLHNIGPNLPKGCTAERSPAQCFFAQYFLDDIYSPTFIVQSAYDTYQIRNFLVPPSDDPQGAWGPCIGNPGTCSVDEVGTLQGFRKEMISALSKIETFSDWGVFLISCFYHAQTQGDSLWSGPSRVSGMSVTDAVGNWASKGMGGKYVDCAYPCNPTCIGVL